MGTIIDPRTGGKLITWNHLDSASFCDLVSTFLESHPNFDENDQNGSAPKRKRLRSEDNIIDADEDDQLAAAIKASLAESQKPTSSDSICDAIKSRLADTYTETPSDSDLEVYSGDDSNLSTPAKKNLFDNGDKTWEEYLGNEEDAKSSIMIRFP